MSRIRKPAVAGYFYPKETTTLRNQVIDLLESTEKSNGFKNIFGIIAPHAGYIYSGRTAAFVYNLVKYKEFKTVIIISPSHREYFPGISIYDGDAYLTPLGIVNINQTVSNLLADNSKVIFRGKQGHNQEHAVEVQLPFLQTVLPDFEIVPVVMGDQGKMFVDELAEQIAKVADEKTLIVASSDLSHYYSKQTANELDSIVSKRIAEFDYDRLQEDLDSRRCEACGAGAILSLMKSADKLSKRKAAVIHRSDSGDVSGDNNEVVGYLSAVIYGE